MSEIVNLTFPILSELSEKIKAYIWSIFYQLKFLNFLTILEMVDLKQKFENNNLRDYIEYKKEKKNLE